MTHASRSGCLRVVRVGYASAATGDRTPRRLARGGLGSIFSGRLYFEGGGRRRVAIKRFNYDIDEEVARRTNECIEALTGAGVRLPKMLICRDAEGAWVQVSPLFGSTGTGSKLGQPNLFYRLLDETEKDFAIDQLTRVVNAAYMPSIDLFVVFKPPRRGLIPIDLDLITPEADLLVATQKLVKILIRIGESAPERDRLLDVARAAASPPVLAHLEELCAEGSLLRRYWALD